MKFTGRFQNLSVCALVAAPAVSCFSGLAFPRFEAQAADQTTEGDHAVSV